jgi:hypothetical protein
MPNSYPCRATRSRHLVCFLSGFLFWTSLVQAQPGRDPRTIVFPVLTRWAWGYGDSRLTLKPTVSADGMVAAADLYALDRPAAIPPQGSPPAYDLILGKNDTIVISADGCIQVDGVWQPFADHGKIQVAGVPETATIVRMMIGGNGQQVPVLGPGPLSNVVSKELLVSGVPPKSGQLQIGYDSGGKSAGYTARGPNGVVLAQPGGQNGCTRRAVVWIVILHDANTARAELTANWNAGHAGNQAFDSFARGSDFNGFDVNPAFFGQLPAAGGDPTALKSRPDLQAETKCGGFPLDSTLEFVQKFGFLQKPDGYRDIFGLQPAFTPPLSVGRQQSPTVYYLPLSFFDPAKTPSPPTWSSPFALNDHLEFGLLQMLFRDISVDNKYGPLGGVRYADSSDDIQQMMTNRIQNDVVNDVLTGNFSAAANALASGELARSVALPLDDPTPSLDDWKNAPNTVTKALSISGLLIDIAHLQALQNDPEFIKASDARKVTRVLPLLDTYFPLLETRWQFERFHSTNIVQAGTAEQYPKYLAAVAAYNTEQAKYHQEHPDCQSAGTHQVLTGPDAGRVVTCPAPPVAPAVVPRLDSQESIPATDCRKAAIDTDQSEICSVGHMFFAGGSGAGGRVNGFSGHINFGQAVYFGQLRYENHSPPRSLDDKNGYDDDDVDWDLETPLGEGSSGGAAHLHVEHSAWSTLRQFTAARNDLMAYCEDSGGNPVDCGKPGSNAIVAPPDFWQVMLDRMNSDWSLRQSLEFATDPGTAIAKQANTPWSPSTVCSKVPAASRPITVSDPQANDWVAKNFLLKGRPANLATWTVNDDCAFAEGFTPAQPAAVTPAIVMGELDLDCYHGCSPELHPAYMMALKLSSRPLQDRWAFFVNRGPADEGLCSRKDHYAAVPANVTFFVPHPGATSADAGRNVVGAWVASRDDLPAGRQNPLFDDGSVIHNPDFRRPLIDVQLVPGQGALVTLKMPSNLGKDGKGVMKFVEGEIVITWNGGSPATAIASSAGAPTWETENTANAALVLETPLQQRLATLRVSDPAAHAQLMQAASAALASSHLVARNPPTVKVQVASSDDLVAASGLAPVRVAPPAATGRPAVSVPLRAPTVPARAGAARSLVCQQVGQGACKP